jgi:5-methylcytosine-specific restriction endonuclease McrA
VANKAAVAERKRLYRASQVGRAKTAEYNAKYAAEHAEELRAKRATFYADTKDERRDKKAEIDKAYRERNAVAIRERRKVAMLGNPAARARNIERARVWYQANKELVAEKERQKYLANREAIKRRVAKYQKEHPEQTRLLHRLKANRRRALLREAGGEQYKPADVERLIAAQAGLCVYCRTSLAQGFHVDHRIPVARGGTNDARNIQLLCPPCNMAKSDKLPEDFEEELERERRKPNPET